MKIKNGYGISTPLNDVLSDEMRSKLFSEMLENGLVPDEIRREFDIDSFKLLYDMHLKRDSYIGRFGFVVVSERLISSLSESLRGRSVIEVGAGTGFLSKKLQDSGIDVHATDAKPFNESQYGFGKTHTEIEIIDGASAIARRHYDDVILSWPSYSTEFATETLLAMKPGQRLHYCGEGYGGCTASDSFFDLLDEKAVINEALTSLIRPNGLSWPGIHDEWLVYDVLK